jgi:hypothetical protein
MRLDIQRNTARLLPCSSRSIDLQVTLVEFRIARLSCFDHIASRPIQRGATQQKTFDTVRISFAIPIRSVKRYEITGRRSQQHVVGPYSIS